MWQHDATIETIVSDEFRESLSGSSENEMMQLDDRERCRDPAIGCNPYGHFAFDREVCEIPEIQGISVPPDLALQKAPSDRPLHPELPHGARSGTTNLIADQTIAGGYPKLRNRVLKLISSGDRQVEIRIGKACPGFTGAVVTPLAISQFL